MAANIEHHQETKPAQRRAELLKNYLVLAMFTGMLLSPQVWLTGHAFPQLPVWEQLPTIPPLLSGVCFALLLGLLLALQSSRSSPIPILTFVGCLVLYCLWDQMRWQPWVYQYGIMFTVLGIARLSPTGEQRQQAALNTCRLVIICLYLWSGLQKINYNFHHDVYPWLIDPVQKEISAPFHSFLLKSASLVPYLEASIGLGLLFWPVRYAALTAALLMHLLILFVLCPLGHNWNSIVWPWNIAMMVFVVVLFWNTRQVFPWDILWPRNFLLARAVLVLCGILPLASFLGLWDAYLSGALYSGNTLRAKIYVSEEVYSKLPASVHQHLHLRPAAGKEEPSMERWPYEVALISWAVEGLNVPPYPARRTYRGIARYLDRMGQQPNGVVLMILERPDWRTGKREQTNEVIHP